MHAAFLLRCHYRWSIPSFTHEGIYRLVHYGNWKPLFGSPRPFTGVSNTFTVTRGQALEHPAGSSAGVSLVSPVKGTRPLTSARGPPGMTKCCAGISDPVLTLTQLNTTALPYSHKLVGPGRDKPLTLAERWSLLTSLYQPTNQYAARFGCDQHYSAWWRGEGGCRQAPPEDLLMQTYCTYGETTHA